MNLSEKNNPLDKDSDGIPDKIDSTYMPTENQVNKDIDEKLLQQKKDDEKKRSDELSRTLRTQIVR